MRDSTVFKGVVHGNTIELDHEPGLPDGQQVILTVQTARARDVGALPPGEGLRRSAGLGPTPPRSWTHIFSVIGSSASKRDEY